MIFFDGIPIVELDETVRDIGVISAIVILFVAGLEITPREFLRGGAASPQQQLQFHLVMMIMKMIRLPQRLLPLTKKRITNHHYNAFIESGYLFVLSSILHASPCSVRIIVFLREGVNVPSSNGIDDTSVPCSPLIDSSGDSRNVLFVLDNITPRNSGIVPPLTWMDDQVTGKYYAGVHFDTVEATMFADGSATLIIRYLHMTNNGESITGIGTGNRGTPSRRGIAQVTGEGTMWTSAPRARRAKNGLPLSLHFVLVHGGRLD
jgi:hypothetical protein